jgi:spore germination protein KB
VGGFSLGAAVMLAIVLTDTAVLGPLLEYFTLPRLESSRLIYVYDVLSRMETLYAFVLVVLRYFKVSVLLYGSALCLAQIFNLNSYVPLVSSLGMLGAFFSLFVFRSVAESYEWGQYTAGVYSAFFNIFLPLLTLAVYLVRSLVAKLKSKKGVR